MTLIPMISTILAARETATAPIGVSIGAPAPSLRNSYGSDGRHHPVAALLAVGLPTALVIAVALSPMVVEIAPKSDPIHGTLVELDKPLDPPAPKPEVRKEATSKTTSTTETVEPTVPLTTTTENVVNSGPKTTDFVIPDAGSAYVSPVDPPKPQLLIAQLDPRFAGVFQPEYPASEQRRELEGVVKVRVLIGADGRVKAVELVSTDSPGFFEETKRRALAKWRFKPATRGGVAEESWKEMTVRFQISKG
ncbi:MAG: TonB family protein [Sphingopyxis sp.]|nr:TonB family protein [Sphingopyxis sp.]